MNKVITDGLVLMPSRFARGLDRWSSGDGTAGSPDLEFDDRAVFVPSDQDFGGCLELVKTEGVQRLRYKTRTPIIPGCYLRVTARVKAISGNLPAVRIAGWAGRGNDVHVDGVTEAAESRMIEEYGDIVEVSAIVGAGRRGGVDLSWGPAAEYGYLGLDLTGPTGGVVRIDDLTIEDVTSVFIADMLPIVDVRDFGAVGDGVADETAAFNAADAAADGREIIVPKGTYRLGGDVYIDTHIRFEGRVVQARDARFVLRKNFDLPSYIDAFGDEVIAFEKAFQALLSNSDHESLDLGGRRIDLDGPIDMARAAGTDVFEIRRVIRNGQFNVKPGAGWTVESVVSQATYRPGQFRERLTGVANVANIAVGAQVVGAGVGREVYVRAKSVAGRWVELSQPLYGPRETQSYTFRRYKYALDFSGFTELSKFTITDVEFQLDGRASGILMAPEGETFHLRDSFVTKPSHRGITSHGRGCQDLQVDRCHFISDEQQVPATQRQSVALNVNANDAKIRDSRFQRFGTTMVLNGQGHLILGNHWFQGDEVQGGARIGGLIFTQPNIRSFVTGNYIDNCSIEWTNEHDCYPGFDNEFSFGGLTVTGNSFVSINAARYFSWIVVKPYGAGHFIHGFSVIGNAFRAINSIVGRIEKVDTSRASLNNSRMRMVEFSGNTFNGIERQTINPAALEFNHPSAERTWTLDPSAYLPFDGWAKTVTSVVPVGRLFDGGGNAAHHMPHIGVMQGGSNDRVQLYWPEKVRGKVNMTVRADTPY